MNKVNLSKSKKHLKNIIERLGWTQLQLATSLGVSRQTVSTWIKGTLRIPSWVVCWLDVAEILLSLREEQSLPVLPISRELIVPGMDNLESFLYVYGYDAIRFFVFYFSGQVDKDSLYRTKEPIEHSDDVLFMGWDEFERCIRENPSWMTNPRSKSLTRLSNSLACAGITAYCKPNGDVAYTLVGDIIQKSKEEFLRIKNFGKKCLYLLEDIVEAEGFNLGEPIENWEERKTLFYERKSKKL